MKSMAWPQWMVLLLFPLWEGGENPQRHILNSQSLHVMTWKVAGSVKVLNIPMSKSVEVMCYSECVITSKP